MKRESGEKKRGTARNTKKVIYDLTFAVCELLYDVV